MVEALVRAMRVEMFGVGMEHCHGVPFVVDEESVGAFLADAADEACVTVGLRCRGCRVPELGRCR